MSTHVLEELGRDILVDRVVLGELERNVEHGERVEAHPPSSVGLAHRAAGGQALGSVERRNVV